MTSTRTAYAFEADRAAEHQRLIPQSRLLDPITEPLLREAGLAPGMHVVDLGSGAGDSALLAARIVGPSGSVLGVERAAEAVALGRRRATDVGFDNVTFVEGDVAEVDDVLVERDVDAVIGRLILMWVPDRLAVLRACARRLRPGALVWFLEPDSTYDDAVPATPLWEQVSDWIEQAARGLGVEPRMAPTSTAPSGPPVFPLPNCVAER